MKRFLKNLGMSALYALLVGVITLSFCLWVTLLGDVPLTIGERLEIYKTVAIITLVFWPLFLAQLIIFTSDDIDPEEEDDTLDEDVEENVSSWEDEGGAI